MTTSPRRVLIIDDNVGLAENLAEILSFDGHAIRIAASAEEAFPKALEDEPDVVVTDFRLPGISGAVFLRQFLVKRGHVRAMVMSGYTDETTIDEARSAGAMFMAKPLDLLGLCRWVGESSAGVDGAVLLAQPEEMNASGAPEPIGRVSCLPGGRP